MSSVKKELYDKYGHLRGQELIELVDKLDREPYGPRYLANIVKSPTFGDLTPLTRKRILDKDL